jgi:GNAT superfamily N-acetyltransferase
MSADVVVRPYVPEDLPEILELMRLSLGETDILQRTPELFRWKHESNPFGPSIVFLATVDGRIVGLRTFMRWRLVREEGSVIECCRPVDTATHPDFQRRGIFSTLTTAAVEHARESGIHLIFNTPNERSRPGYLKLGWREVGGVPVLARVRPIRWLTRGEGPPRTSGTVDPRELEPRPRRGLHTPQSEQYLRWRFCEHPTVAYRAVAGRRGATVVRPDRRWGRLGVAVSDVFGPEPASAMRDAWRRMPGAYMVASFPRHTRERGAARRSGLLPVPWLRALTLVARPLVDLDFDVTDPDRWQLSLSDLELL